MITPAMSRAAARAVNVPGVTLEDARTVAEAAITAASDAAFLQALPARLRELTETAVAHLTAPGIAAQAAIPPGAQP